jgi:hypothetical protein
MANDLLSPILNDLTRSVNFFNGRLLTGEDLTAEQQANRVAHGLLGKAIGSGVAYGLEVSEPTPKNIKAPLLKITRGLAINRNGAALLLNQDIEIALTRPAPGPSTLGKVFDDCEPVQSGVYVAGAAVYLLTIGPAAAPLGLAEVSGVNTGAAPCNSRYKAEGVQFRRIQISLTDAEMSDVNRLRNVVAYKCFGVADWAAVVADPFGGPPANFGLVDEMRSQQLVSDCEVPLAIFYWTAKDGLGFVDMWAVRRPLVSRDLLDAWAPGAGRRRFAEGLAMFLQFQEQVAELEQSSATVSILTSIAGTDYFRYLPPFGLLPLSGTKGAIGLDYPKFFYGQTYRNPVYIEGSKLEALFRRSLLYPPIKLSFKEMMWFYWVRENMKTIVETPFIRLQSYMVFTNGQMSFEGESRFDLNYWDYANYV